MILDTRGQGLLEVKEQVARIWNPEMEGQNG